MEPEVEPEVESEVAPSVEDLEEKVRFWKKIAVWGWVLVMVMGNAIVVSGRV